MVLQVYSILDVKLGAYSRPFCSPNDAVAIRSFGDMVSERDHPIAQHPEDFVLYRLCAFYLDSGEFAEFEMRNLAKATDFVRSA